MTTDPKDLPEAEQDRLIDEGLLDPAAVGRERELIIPGIDEIREAAAAAHTGNYAGVGPADDAQHIAKAFVVYTDPASGAWTASSLVGSASVMRQAGSNIKIVGDTEPSVDDFHSACSIVLRDIQAMATAEHIIASQQMMMRAMQEQQHTQAIQQKLQSQGIRVPGQ